MHDQIPSTDRIPTDFPAMLDFHRRASKDRSRARWLRLWHERQASAIERHDMTFNWALACWRASQRIKQATQRGIQTGMNAATRARARAFYLRYKQ
jgi:hypothetical protein